MAEKISSKQMNEYCTLLGVKPGATPEEVKHAFRACIKSTHPDTNKEIHPQKTQKLTRKLIEAYQALKNGVPHPPIRLAQTDHVVRESATERHHSSFWKDFSSKKATALNSEGIRTHSATQIFENSGLKEALKNNSTRQQQKNLFDLDTILQQAEDLSDEASDSQDKFQEEINVNHYAQQAKTIDKKLKAQEEEYFNRAEQSLRDVVSYFNSSPKRFHKSWARKYIRNLLEIQILYRDICNFSIILSPSALQRTKQISDLIRTIKKVV